MKNVGTALAAVALLASCWAETNQNYNLTVLHPDTDRGQATMVTGFTSRVLGNFTSQAFFGPQAVTLTVTPLGTRTVFEGFENVLHYYGIDGDSNTSTWTLGTTSVSFTVGQDWKTVKLHLRPETNANPLALTRPDGTALGVIYQSNVFGVNWPSFVTVDGQSVVTLGTPDLTTNQRPWRRVEAWKGLEWVLVRSENDEKGWAAFPETSRMEALWTEASAGPRVWAQWGAAGFYYLTTWYGEDQKLQWVDPESGAQTTLATFAGTGTTLIGPAADGTIFALHDASLSGPEGVQSRVEVFRLHPATHQLEPIPFAEGPNGQAMMVTDFDPSTGRLLAVGWPWAGSTTGSLWIVDGDSTPHWSWGTDGPQQIWNARLSDYPHEILALDQLGNWRRWDLDRLPTPGAPVGAPDDYSTSPHLWPMQDYSVLNPADDQFADGTRVVPELDGNGAQDLRLRGPEGQLGVYLTGPRRGGSE